MMYGHINTQSEAYVNCNLYLFLDSGELEYMETVHLTFKAGQGSSSVAQRGSPDPAGLPYLILRTTSRTGPSRPEGTGLA